MSLAAKTIRQAVVARLRALATRAGDRVFGNRTRPVWKDTLPVVLVFTKAERSEIQSLGQPLVYRRMLELVVEIVDHAIDLPLGPVDDRLDDLAEIVEREVFADPTFGLGYEMRGDPGQAWGIQDVRLEAGELVLYAFEGREGERPLAAVDLTFRVVYLAEAQEGRSEDLEPFHGADISWKLKPGDDLEDAHDRVELGGS